MDDLRVWRTDFTNVSFRSADLRGAVLGGTSQKDSRRNSFHDVDDADRVNRKTRNADRARYEGMEIHEIHPVKFGGHPTDPANKMVLPVEQHRLLNGWWRRRQSILERDKSK